MKTSDWMSWECKAFHTWVSWISSYRAYGHESTESYIIYGYPNIIKLREKSSYKSDIKLLQDWIQNPWKLVMQWHENVRFSHISFLDLELNSIWELKCRVLNHIFLPKHHKTHIKFLIQIWYKTTSRLNPNPWKLDIQEHEECKPFIHVFLIFQPKKNMDVILHIYTS